MAMTLLFFISCEEKLADLSVDPNVAFVANDSEVLTSAQGYLAIVQDVDLNQGSFLWAQYYTWGIGVSIGNQERYVAEPDDRDGYWGRAYTNILADTKYLSNSENAAYRGVGKILHAYTFQGLVDHFGDIPYFEALNGEVADGSNVAPAFDNAALIYADLVKLLDEALAEFDLAVLLEEDQDIGSDDVVYGGDLDKWTRFANSLKLRILMRTSEVDPKGAEIVALINDGTFLESAGDLAQVQWTGSIGDQNPMYATQLSGVGDFYFASNATVEFLNGLNDPRVDYFYSQASSGTVVAIDQGAVDRDVPFTANAADYSGSSSYANGQAVPTVLMSPWEVWFLRAEAAARYTTSDDDATAFATAIQMNFDAVGAGDASVFITNLGYGGSLDARLDLIGTQKWVSMNGTQEDEGWIETRRFDRPASRIFSQSIFQTPVLSVLGNNVHPRTWLYPASELSFNPTQAPLQRTLITSPLFWDN